ncbi:MAG TPA: hypothetical protein PLM16_02830, partial [Candidatus Woesebacteria bacterium]|nr:hypothetical protein [Candidatus Woesebacteria bacterium]
MSEIVTSKYETPTIVTEGEFFDFNASVPLKAEYAVLLMDLLPTLIPNATVHQLLGLTRFAIYLRGHQLGVANKRILEAINLHFPAKLTENTSLEALNQAKPAGDFLKLTDSLVVGQLRQSLLSGQRFGRRTWKGPFIPLDLYTAALPNIYFINHWDRLVGVVSQFLGEQFDNVLLLNLIMVTQSGLIKERLINRTLVSAIRAANIEQAHLLVGRPTEEIPAETLFNQMCQELALGYQYLLQARELLNFHVRRLGSQYLKTNKAALTDPSLSEYQSNPTDLAHYLLDLIKAVIFIKTTQLTQEQQRMVGNQYQEVVMAVGSADLARAKQLIIDLMIA